MKKKLFLAGLLLFLATLILSMPQSSQASDLPIVPTNSSVSTSVEYCIGAAAPVAGWAADDFIEIEFASGFDLTGLTISDTDTASELTLYVGTVDCTAGGADVRILEATETADNNRDYGVISGQKFNITLEDAVAGSTVVSIKFEDKTDVNSNAVVTPATPGNYLIIGRWGPSSTGVQDGADADFVYIGGANEIEISATVDPSITLALSGATCALGTFSASDIQTCNYNVTLNTNGASGYTAYIKDDGNLRNATNDIDDTAGGTIAAGTEEYGISTSKDSQTITRINDADSDLNYDADDCIYMDGGTTDANASALTTSDQTFASAAAPVSDDITYLCHAVSITGATPAGVYSQIVTITAVGNF